MYLDPKYLALAFHEGPHGSTQLRQKYLGELNMPSGKLVACDPFVFANTQPFSLLLPQGTYAGVLSVARLDGDERVAFARIDLAHGEPVSWDLIVVPGQDLSKLGPNEVFGYAVDAGTGCFADQHAMEELRDLMNADGNYWEKIQDEMEKTCVHTWSWVNWRLPSGANILAFNSGWGDGVYSTYVARNASGTVLSIVTDFQVLYAGGSR